MSKLSKEEAESMLPSAPSKAKVDPLQLVYLAVAPPKFGKTTFFCDFEDALLVAFEAGHTFQSAHKFVITDWKKRAQADVEVDENGVFYGTFERLVEILEATDKFKFIILDTVDMAVKMCIDYHLNKMNVAHAQDAGDYGKGYDLVQNTPFRQLVGRIMRTGRGVAFITHQKINTNKFSAGEKGKKETTLPSGIFNFVHSQADVILHGLFGRKIKGQNYRDRVWQTEGDEDTLAGSRIKNCFIPPRYVIDPDKPFLQWCKFFEDEDFAVKEYEKFQRRQKGETLPETPAKSEPEPEPDSSEGEEEADEAPAPKAKRVRRTRKTK